MVVVWASLSKMDHLKEQTKFSEKIARVRDEIRKRNRALKSSKALQQERREN